MAKAFTVLVVILVGGVIDLGVYRFVAYLSASGLGRRLRLLCGLLAIAVIWVVVPLGGYYACSSRGSASAGYLAAVVLFVAGFMLVTVFGERGEYSRGLRRLGAEDQQVTDPADGSP